jgi:hypothetical protein
MRVVKNPLLLATLFVFLFAAACDVGGIVLKLELSGDVTITPDSALVGEELEASYSGEETVSYQWSKDGEAIADATDTTFTPEEAGSYTVTVSAEGYRSKTSASVAVSLPDE